MRSDWYQLTAFIKVASLVSSVPRAAVVKTTKKKSKTVVVVDKNAKFRCLLELYGEKNKTTQSFSNLSPSASEQKSAESFPFFLLRAADGD